MSAMASGESIEAYSSMAAFVISSYSTDGGQFNWSSLMVMDKIH
jgi:hypothetical protein